MKTLTTLLATAVLITAGAPSARATTRLLTPMLGAADGARLVCLVQNHDKKPVAATLIEIVDPFQAVDSQVLVTIECPGGIAVAGVCFAATGSTGFKNAYCRVTSSSGKVRGALWVQRGDDTISALPLSK